MATGEPEGGERVGRPRHMTLTPAQAVAQVDSPRHDWDELSDHYKAHCRNMAAAAVAAFKVNEANVAPDGPPLSMRLPSGEVAYTTMRAGEVVPGMWVWSGGYWRQVLLAGACGDDRVMFTMDNDLGYACSTGLNIKVATMPEALRLAAERQAQQAEAYDQACEART